MMYLSIVGGGWSIAVKYIRNRKVAGSIHEEDALFIVQIILHFAYDPLDMAQNIAMLSPITLLGGY
jgi:hypothetical protein